MSRYDKYDPKNGGYRATLAADYPPELVGHCVGVGHDEDGRLVVGAGESGLKGVLVLTKAYRARTRVDVMTSGEIVEFGPSDEGSEAGVDLAEPGKNFSAQADGTVVEGNGGAYVGHTVEGQRLIVRFVAATA